MRRLVLLLALAVAIAGCLAGPAPEPVPPAAPGEGPTAAPAPGHDDGHGHGEASCDATPDMWAEAFALQNATREALAPYDGRVDRAFAAGYHLFPWNEDMNLVLHVFDPPSTQDADTMDVGRPEGIVFAMTDEGYRPLGAMFAVPQDVEPPVVAGCLAEWHEHASGDLSTGWLLHVWIVDMPSGIFAHVIDHAYVRSLWTPTATVNPLWPEDCGVVPVACDEIDTL